MSDVLFPIFGCDGASIATVRCDRLEPKDYPAGRALVLARDEREIERILADARAHEPTGAEIARPIWVRFIPQQFSGRSYGLALALADKLARYRRNQPLDGRIFASGIIIEDGSGRIGDVEAFDDKLAAITDDARSGDVVVMPKGNVDRASSSTLKLLECLDANGVICRSADHLDQLCDLHGASAIAVQAPASEDELLGRDEKAPGSSLAAMTAGEPQTRTLDQRNARAENAPASVSAGTLVEPDHDQSSSIGRGIAAGRGEARPLRAGVIVLAGLAIASVAFVAGNLWNNSSIVALHANEARTEDAAASGPNLLENPSFEQGDGQQPIGWRTFSRGKHDDADRVVAGGSHGSLVLEHGSTKAFYVDTAQVLHVPEGFYALSAWIDSDGPKKANRMFANGDKRIEVDIPVTPSGHFEQLRIHCIRVTEGRLAVGFYTDVHHGSATRYDDVQLVEHAKGVDGQDCQEVHAAGNLSANAPAKVVVHKKPRSPEVKAGKNLLENASFEQGEGQVPVGWLTYSRGKHDDADRVVTGGIDGALMLEHGGDEAFYVDTHQVMHVPDGFYTFSAWILANGKKKVNRMYARGDQSIEIDIPDTGIGRFQQLQIDCIKVTNRRLVVGFYKDVHRASRTAYDSLQLLQSPNDVDGQACSE